MAYALVLARFVKMNNKYTSDILTPIVKSSISIAEVLNKLWLRQAWWTHSHIKYVINKFNIDTSHFLWQWHNKWKQSVKRLSSNEVCMVLKDGSHRAKTYVLKRSMLDLWKEHCCEICWMDDIWNWNPITLEIDHIDWNWLDNRIWNLRFLCPNCHSQQQTNQPYKFG